MSVEPPSSGRPTGPPSGPLSGPSQPPSGPPSQPPPGSGGGSPAPQPRRPWWKSAPRVAVLTTAVVAAVVLAVVLTQSDGGGASGKSGEVFLQAAGKTGPDPFTPSTAKDNSTATVSASPTAPESTPANSVRGVDGGAAGLYGGTRNVSSCDVEKQIRYLQSVPAKNQAFASVEGIQPSQVPAYLRALTPVQLRMDTRVTNHGYHDGTATGYQAVLQAGTAVLVDGHGVPRTRCACGNPLTPPVAQQTTPTPTGDSWPSYRSSNVVVVTPAPQIINVFVIYDPDHDQWIGRHRGDTGHKDHPAKPPARPSPSVSVTTPTAPSSSGSPSPCVSSPAPGVGTTKPSLCPSTSAPPSSPSSSSSGPTPPSSSSESPPKPESSPGSSPPEPPLASDSTTVSAPVSSATTPSA
ncbi:DUF6777 domain-containing protein [Streptomyces sp. MBT33]|uniref:DUF6777 domain-containing protein n=1 Tax=Streptomyces sp. MBT33 TaxID=1488363 RepID=UPI00190DEF28|nr:DUF6777 domain-containing protein [Streptomyces sp. MBT33]MBK3645128.1 hypothetical protein [Streptomyces sp. MBT33]